MKFAATLAGITPKESGDAKTIEIKLVAQFDSALFAQLGDCFGERAAVELNQAQGRLELEEGQAESRSR